MIKRKKKIYLSENGQHNKKTNHALNNDDQHFLV